MSKVYDCCMFFNELDMLETRFHILEDVVDHFVVCEAAETHSGRPKPYHLLDNKDRFARWYDKLIYVQVDNLTGPGRNSWERERYHRAQIASGLTGAAPDDWIIVGDCDEIPSPEAVAELKHRDWMNRAKLELAMYYYDANHRVEMGWAIGAYHHAVEGDPNRIRTCADGLAVPFMPPGKVNCGWHFSWFGGAQAAVEKADAFMHANDVAAHLPRDPVYIADKIAAGQDLFERADFHIVSVPLSNGLPQYILDHLDYYRQLGWVRE